MNDTDESLTISVSPGEILQPGETIEIRSKRAIARRFAQSAVRLSRHGAPIPITVRVGARGHSLSVSTADLEPGPYDPGVTRTSPRSTPWSGSNGAGPCGGGPW